MGVRFPSVFTTTSLGVLAANGAETIIATTPPLTLPLDFASVFLHWWFAGSSGNGTTGLSVAIRRGVTLAGTLITAAAAVLVTANNIVNVAGCFVDTPGAVAGQQYTLTLTGTATTGVGTTLDVCLFAYCF